MNDAYIITILGSLNAILWAITFTSAKGWITGVNKRFDKVGEAQAEVSARITHFEMKLSDMEKNFILHYTTKEETREWRGANMRSHASLHSKVDVLDKDVSKLKIQFDHHIQTHEE